MRKAILKFLSLTVLSAMLLGSAACAPGNGGGTTGTTTKSGTATYKATLTAQEITPFPDAFVSGMNAYGWNAAALLYDGKNLALSPASLELALLMTRTGAIDETAEEMKTALFMSDLSDEDILAACKQLMWRSNTNGMEAANSLWMQKDYPFSDAFIRTCNENFMTDAFSVDFAGDAAGSTDQINAWASEKTHGKIPEMNPQPLRNDTRLVLINALYFLGKWETPFVYGTSYNQVFHGASGDKETSFMHDMRGMLYSETPSFQMISLPFKGSEKDSDSPYSMAFILPGEGQDISSVMKELAAGGFSESCDALATTSVQLALPKFEYTFDTSMVKTMQALGMERAFTGSAQLDGMTGGKNGLFISDIFHKCYIRVDEEGAEAAAVTEVVVEETAAPAADKLI